MDAHRAGIFSQAAAVEGLRFICASAAALRPPQTRTPAGRGTRRWTSGTDVVVVVGVVEEGLVVGRSWVQLIHMSEGQLQLVVGL